MLIGVIIADLVKDAHGGFGRCSRKEPRNESVHQTRQAIEDQDPSQRKCITKVREITHLTKEEMLRRFLHQLEVVQVQDRSLLLTSNGSLACFKIVGSLPLGQAHWGDWHGQSHKIERPLAQRCLRVEVRGNPGH